MTDSGYRYTSLLEKAISTTHKRNTVVTDNGSPSEDTTEEETDTEPNLFLEKIVKSTEMDFQAWTILKSIKYMKYGDPIACGIAMRSILSCNLSLVANHAAVMEEDGLEMLVNLTEVNDFKCRFSALEVLKQITTNQKIATLVVLLGLAPILCVRLSDSHARDEIEVVCDVIANIGRKRRAGRVFRRKKGIDLLISFLDVKKELLLLPGDALNKKEKQKLSLAKAAANALWVLSRFTKNKKAILKSGIVGCLTPILVSKNPIVCPPLICLLSECSNVFGFHVVIETEGLVGILLNIIQSDSKDTKIDPLEDGTSHYALTALMGAAGGRKTVRHMIKHNHGYRILKKFLIKAENDKVLLADALGVIWKSSLDHENLHIVEQIGLDKQIVKYLYHPDLNVQMMAAGAVGEICKNKTCRQNIIAKGAVPLLCAMFARIDQPEMYANAAFALGEIAKDKQGIEEIDGFDGLRLLWSHLKYPDDKVQYNVARALVPCITHTPDSGELIRGLTGSLVMLVQTLSMKEPKILAATCALIAAVALDEENLGVMSEEGIVKRLSAVIIREDTEAAKHEVMRTDHLGLHRDLAAAIGNCCLRAENRVELGQRGVIPHLINYINTKDNRLKEVASGALYALSRDLINCVILHTCGAVPLLLTAISCDNEHIQSNAAACLSNIRRTLLVSETDQINKRCESFTTDSGGAKRKVGKTEGEIFAKLSEVNVAKTV